MKIIVKSEQEKQDLIEQSKYIHDFLEVLKDENGKEVWIGLDSDKANTLMHIYMAPEIIEVKPL